MALAEIGYKETYDIFNGPNGVIGGVILLLLVVLAKKLRENYEYKHKQSKSNDSNRNNA